jgi:uncharacterized protein (DUF2147 family)
MTSIPFLKGRIVLTFLVSLAITSPTTASEDQSLAGRWTTQDRSAVINFAPCGTRICATVIEVQLGPNALSMQDATLGPGEVIKLDGYFVLCREKGIIL